MKNNIQRTLYLGYYFKQMDWALLKKFLTHASNQTGKSKTSLFFESIRDVYKYNISVLEYFLFAFYGLPKEEKEIWAGTGTMYEFQKISNPISERWILMDKGKFYANYKEFFKHHLYTITELENDQELIAEIYNANEKIVIKEKNGKAGCGVEDLNTKKLKEKE